MEIKSYNWRDVVIKLGVAICFWSMFQSCTQQKSLATSKSIYTIVYQDTFIVPKHLRPSTIAKQQKPTKTIPIEQSEKDVLKLISKDNAQIDVKSLKQLYDAIQVLANDRVNVARSYRSMAEQSRGMEGKIDSLSYRVAQEQIARKKEKELQQKATEEKRVRDQVNNTIMYWGLAIIIFFSVAHFAFSIFSSRNNRKNKQLTYDR